MKEYPLNNMIAIAQIRETLGLPENTPCADVVRAVRELKEASQQQPEAQATAS